MAQENPQGRARARAGYSSLRQASTTAYALLSLVILTIGTPDLRGQGADKGRFLRWAMEDPAGIVSSVHPRSLFIAAGGITGVIGVSRFDRKITDEVTEDQGGFASPILAVTNEFGGRRAKLPVAAIFGLTLLTRNERLQDAAFTSLESLVYAGSISYVAKALVGRRRPYQSDDPYSFDPISKYSSFPSGHTAAAFAVLMPWAFYYPHPVTFALAVAGGAGTAMARIAYSKHWASDVLAGAAIGFFTARALSRRHMESSRRIPLLNSWRVTPAIAPRQLSVSLTRTR